MPRILAVLLASIATACAARAPMPLQVIPDVTSTDWRVVTRLHRGTPLRVDLTDDQQRLGRLVAATGDDLIMTRQNRDETWPRSSVVRVFVIGRRTGEKALRGWVIGTIASGLGTLLLPRPTPWPVIGWGAFGALKGAWDGSSDIKETLIYASAAGGSLPCRWDAVADKLCP